ncbi:MAG: TetR family transcriptional regulator [Aquihabitans sp.]
MEQPSGIRERKKIERRQLIEESALALFETNGFAATTIEDIATSADIAPRTFFSYFATKEDVVLADYAARLQRITSELEQRPADEAPWEALRAAFMVVASDYQRQRQDLIRRFTIMATTPSVQARNLQLQAGWEDTLAQSLARRMGDAPGQVDPRLLAGAALAGMRASLHQWFATGHRSPLPTILSEAFDQLGRGLA